MFRFSRCIGSCLIASVVLFLPGCHDRDDKVRYRDDRHARREEPRHTRVDVQVGVGEPAPPPEEVVVMPPPEEEVVVAPPPQVVIVREAPPPVRVEVRPAPPPGPCIWIGGYWRHDGHRYAWFGGRYERGRPGYQHVPAHWTHSRRGWEFRGEHWSRGPH